MIVKFKHLEQKKRFSRFQKSRWKWTRNKKREKEIRIALDFSTTQWWEEQHVSHDPLNIPDWVWKLNWQRQIYRRKEYKFYRDFTCPRKPSQENKELKKWLEPKAFILLDKETIPFEELTRQRFWTMGGKKRRSNKVCLYRLPNKFFSWYREGT